MENRIEMEELKNQYEDSKCKHHDLVEVIQSKDGAIVALENKLKE